jgi:hypothetical protein
VARISAKFQGISYAMDTKQQDLKVALDHRVLYISNLGTEAVDFSIPSVKTTATALSPQRLRASLDGADISGTLPSLSAAY